MEQVSTIASQLLPIVITILAPVLLLVIVYLVRKFANKLDLENKEMIEVITTKLVHQGIGYAEQIALHKAKENMKVSSNDKLYLATQFIINELEKQGLVDLAQDEIMNKIESYLGIDTYNQNLDSISKGIISEEDMDNEEDFS